MSEFKINSWTTEAKKLRGSMPPRCDVREIKRVRERAGLENKDPVYDDSRIIVEKGQLAPKAESRCRTRRHLAPYGLEEIELQHEKPRLDAAGALYVPITEYRQSDPVTRSPLSIVTPETRGAFRWKTGLRMP